MNIDVVIPWRDPGDITRRNNAEFVIDWYKNFEVGQVVTASDGRTGGPFNRSLAYNRGFGYLDDPDVILWVEADTLLQPEQIIRAAELAKSTGSLVVPFTERHELTKDATLKMLQTGIVDARGAVVHGGGWSIGAAGVTTADAVRSVGGWHEGFNGWGYDDNAMFHIFSTLAGKPNWVSGNCLHLWHSPAGGAGAKPSEEAQEQTEKNRMLFEELRKMSPMELYRHNIRSNNGRIV